MTWSKAFTRFQVLHSSSDSEFEDLCITRIMAELALKESRLRSILKGLTWRVLATTTTAIIAYFVTGSIKPALAIGGVEFVSKFFIYYLHERAWQAVPKGKIREASRKPRKYTNFDPGI